MSSGLIPFVVVVVVVGLFTLLLGYLIKAKRMASLIAGFDPKRTKDVRGLTNWVGGNVMLVGAVFCVYGLIPLLLRQMPGLLFHLGVTAISFALILRTALRANRF